MVILDRLLFGGLRFVLDKVATAVESELNDEGRLREDLLAAQMQHELGEIDDEEMAQIESDVMERLREIRAARGARGEESGGLRPGARVVGVEISMDGSEDEG